jgi:hypothetical protein
MSFPALSSFLRADYDGLSAWLLLHTALIPPACTVTEPLQDLTQKPLCVLRPLTLHFSPLRDPAAYTFAEKIIEPKLSIFEDLE